MRLTFRVWIGVLSGLLPVALMAQSDTTEIDVRWARVALVSGASIGLTGGVWIGLNDVWYADYERTVFHSFDDGPEWLGMDKAGHLWSGYNGGRWGHAMLRWAGVEQRRSALIGGSMGLVFLTGVEVMDGHSSGWGFSWWDMAANTAGAGLFIGQQLAWKEQRLTVKLSAHHTAFASQRPDLLGTAATERLLKDYNGQTIWLSGNLHAFGVGGDRFPKWLNVALGYGAENMVSGVPGSFEAQHGNGPRFTQVFLSVDADLTRIRSRSSVVRTLLFLANCIKIPAPALEFRENRVLLHGFYF
ncbi:MAG: DUF2279 domain-containing protein [Flavobacteriales bacterium]